MWTLWGTIILPHQKCFRVRGTFNSLSQKVSEHHPVGFLLQVRLQAGNNSPTQGDTTGPFHSHSQDTQTPTHGKEYQGKAEGLRDTNVQR